MTPRYPQGAQLSFARFAILNCAIVIGAVLVGVFL